MGLPIVDEGAVAVLDALGVLALALPLGRDVGGRWAAAAAGVGALRGGRLGSRTVALCAPGAMRIRVSSRQPSRPGFVRTTTSEPPARLVVSKRTFKMPPARPRI